MFVKINTDGVFGRDRNRMAVYYMSPEQAEGRVVDPPLES